MLELHAPLTTPFDAEEKIDFDAFLANLAWYDSQPLDGYLVNGSSGEAEMLTASEQNETLRLATQATKRPVLAGISATSVLATLHEIEAVQHLPLSGVLLRTPSYFGSQLDQVRYYREVADRSPLPIWIYQIPQNTGIKLDASTLQELSTHRNIVGIKDSLGDLSMLQEAKTRLGFRYLLGAANLIAPGVRCGAVGGILALADVVPVACRRLLNHLEQGQWVEAQHLQQSLIPLSRALGGSQGFGIAGLKAAVGLVAPTGGPPRRPLKPLSPAGLEALQALVRPWQEGQLMTRPTRDSQPSL